mmetsp:Transcript_30170/g.47287  ORF Transcript_30170/g.47287 Transcript_30170/m.47287 type:complete len:203 (-) Transcript_30170:905-1513(-)
MSLPGVQEWATGRRIPSSGWLPRALGALLWSPCSLRGPGGFSSPFLSLLPTFVDPLQQGPLLSLARAACSSAGVGRAVSRDSFGPCPSRSPAAFSVRGLGGACPVLRLPSSLAGRSSVEVRDALGRSWGAPASLGPPSSFASLLSEGVSVLRLSSRGRARLASARQGRVEELEVRRGLGWCFDQLALGGWYRSSSGTRAFHH